MPITVLPTAEVMVCDPHDPAALDRAFADMDAVVNLVGILHASRRQSFRACHVELPRKVAMACTRAGVGHLLHMSALGADAKGPSEYQRSKGEGWVPVPGIVDALDAAFYLAFGAVEPSNKRLVLGLDVSGSMFGGAVSGVPALTPGVASAALALVTAATERDCELMAFSHKLVPLTISPRQRLDDVVKAMNRIPMGATDCALPMLWAMERKIKATISVGSTAGR